MDEFVQLIRDKLSDSRSHLTIVRNTDGFLLRPDTQQAMLDKGNILLMPIQSALELRVRYELKDSSSIQTVCYIISHDIALAPDLIGKIIPKGIINLSDFMPTYSSLELKKMNQSWENVRYIYYQRFTYGSSSSPSLGVSSPENRMYGVSVEEWMDKLNGLPLKWDKNETIETISRIILQAIKADRYDAILPAINQINSHFQEYLTKQYDSFINSSAVSKPKMVHKVLPYIAKRHTHDEKVALVVVDGMTYWQYLLLEKQLKDKGIQPHNDMTLAWLPTITQLSRQAIFRGEAPHFDYQQNPNNESKLWNNFWTSTKRKTNKLSNFEIEYQHGSLSLDDTSRLRIAMVDTDLDEKMHASTDNKDLYSLTENWAARTVDDVVALHESGYKIYITTDHGSVLAIGWRVLSSQEKTFLYSDGSRGTRHLIYEKNSYMNDFINSNAAMADEWRCRESMLMWKTDKCFKNNDCITHGGSHLLEVVIPFITI